MLGKALFKLTLAGWLVFIGWVNPGWASDVTDYCQQLYKNGQYEQAFPVCSKSAEQGDAGAQYNLGLMYHFGEGVHQDYAKAAKWYRRAAEQGDAEAQYYLGLIYYNGWSVQRGYSEAMKWYRKSAEQGYADAQYNLGFMYYNGEGVQPDYAKAAKWYRRAAEQGDAEAQYNLGLMYYNGKGVQQDYAEAAKWYRLGLIYQNGKAPSWWLFMPTKIKKLVLLEPLLRFGTWKAVQVFRIISR